MVKREGSKHAEFRELRRLSNEERALKNKELRECGEPTPWEAAKIARKARRVGKSKKKEPKPLDIMFNEKRLPSEKPTEKKS